MKVEWRTKHQWRSKVHWEPKVESKVACLLVEYASLHVCLREWGIMIASGVHGM